MLKFPSSNFPGLLSRHKAAIEGERCN